MNNIMIVDGNPSGAGLLAGIFRKEGIGVQIAGSAQEALDKLKTYTPDLIILEILLPDANGFILCVKIKEKPGLKDIPIIFSSTSTSTSDKIKCYTLGAVDYIQKPFNQEEFKAKVKVHLSMQEQKSKISEEISLYEDRINKIDYSLLYALGKVSQAKDNVSGKHIERVPLFCKIIAEELQKNPSYKPQITPQFINLLRQVSTFHDIGKIAIPDNILLKAEPLSSEELEIEKQHTTFGVVMLESIIRHHGNSEALDLGKNIVKHHHENWDGSGYPDRLSSSHIPLAARIVAIASNYDYERAKGLSHKEACEKIVIGKGRAFDPHIIEAFISVNNKIEEALLQIDSQAVKF